MNETTHRKLIARIHRLQGQINALERHIPSENYQAVIIQIEAIVAAARAILVEYSMTTLSDKLDDSTRATLERLIKKFS